MSETALDAHGPLLETRFYSPRRGATQVDRARLVAKLERGVRSKLTLISAPPGSGKTTLLAEWLAARGDGGPEVAWLSLEAGDNDARTFWTYLFTALNRVRPGPSLEAAIASMGAQQPPPVEHLLTRVLNESAANPADLALVLDDYHVIDAPAVHVGVAFLMEHLPPQMHLVIASRSDPALSLPRLRTRGELTEIRAADLRFTAAEAAEFLNGAMGLALTPPQVEALEARTEGWIAALQLAALSMEGRGDAGAFIAAFSGDDRFIVDYLAEEVLARQPAAVRDFLLRTSVLERLSAALCDAVTGEASGKEALESLERANLFLVPLDGKRQWFRYHHLFADVLRAHLADEMPGEVPSLHRRASDWYAAAGEPESAIRHALAAKDMAQAARLIELQAESVQIHHQPHRLLEWLRHIPPEIVRSMPVLSTYYGHALQGIGDLEASAARLDDAERWLAPGADRDAMVLADPDGWRALPSRLAVGRGFITMATGNLEGTVQHANRALELLREDEYHWLGTAAALVGLAHWSRGELAEAEALHARAVASFERTGDSGLAVTSAYHDAELLKALGKISQAEERYQRSIAFAIPPGRPALTGAANLHIGFSDLCCERDDLEGADEHLRLADEVGVYPPRTPFRHLVARARVARCREDYEAAIGLLREAERIQVRGAVPDFRPVGAQIARVHLAQGDVGAAIAWSRARGLSADDAPDYLREFEHLTLARVLISMDEDNGDRHALANARDLLGRLRLSAEAGGRIGALVETLVLESIAHEAAGDAHAAFERALSIAETAGFVRVFRDEGDRLAPLVRAAAAAPGAGRLARRLAATLVGTAGSGSKPHPGANDADALSEREMDVLRLLRTDLSGPDIADALVVSVNTVRTHTKNIYAKLQVGTRRAAVRRADELGLF